MVTYLGLRFLRLRRGRRSDLFPRRLAGRFQVLFVQQLQFGQLPFQIVHHSAEIVKIS